MYLGGIWPGMVVESVGEVVVGSHICLPIGPALLPAKLQQLSARTRGKSIQDQDVDTDAGRFQVIPEAVDAGRIPNIT